MTVERKRCYSRCPVCGSAQDGYKDYNFGEEQVAYEYVCGCGCGYWEVYNYVATEYEVPEVPEELDDDNAAKASRRMAYRVMKREITSLAAMIERAAADGDCSMRLTPGAEIGGRRYDSFTDGQRHTLRLWCRDNGYEFETGLIAHQDRISW